MLKKGKFIKDKIPVEIGKHWQPSMSIPNRTKEDRLIYALIMGYRAHVPSTFNNFIAQLLRL
jgi:hypothetical protein